MSEKYLIKISTEGEYGVEGFVMKLKDGKHDMAGPLITMLAGVVDGLLDIVQLHEDENGIKHSICVPIEQIQNSFQAITEVLADVEITQEEKNKIIDKLERNINDELDDE